MFYRCKYSFYVALCTSLCTIYSVHGIPYNIADCTVYISVQRIGLYRCIQISPLAFLHF